MTPEKRPPTPEEARQTDMAKISADPEVQKYRKMGGLGDLTEAEYEAGAAKAKTEAVEGAKQPGRLEGIRARSEEVSAHIDQRAERRAEDKPAPKNYSEKDYTGADGNTYTRVFDSTTGKSQWRDAEGNTLKSAPPLANAITAKFGNGPKAKVNDSDAVRAALVKKGDFKSLAAFDKQNEKSGLSPAVELKGRAAGGPGVPAHEPLNAQSGQDATQSGLVNFHVNPQTGERIGWDGKNWVPAPSQ